LKAATERAFSWCKMPTRSGQRKRTSGSGNQFVAPALHREAALRKKTPSDDVMEEGSEFSSGCVSFQMRGQRLNPQMFSRNRTNRGLRIADCATNKKASHRKITADVAEHCSVVNDPPAPGNPTAKQNQQNQHTAQKPKPATAKGKNKHAGI